MAENSNQGLMGSQAKTSYPKIFCLGQTVVFLKHKKRWGLRISAGLSYY
jgi:hypothetical protein